MVPYAHHYMSFISPKVTATLKLIQRSFRLNLFKCLFWFFHTIELQINSTLCLLIFEIFLNWHQCIVFYTIHCFINQIFSLLAPSSSTKLIYLPYKKEFFGLKIQQNLPQNSNFFKNSFKIVNLVFYINSKKTFQHP